MGRIILIFIVLSTLFHSSYSQVSPLNIRYGIYVKSIEIDSKSSTFKCDFFWWLTYPNNFDTTAFVSDDIPKIDFINCDDCSDNEIEDDKIEKRILAATNETYINGHTKKSFHFDADFKDYPFDNQKLQIIIEHVLLTDDKVVLIPDTVSYDKSNQPENMWGVGIDILQLNGTSFKTDSSGFLDTKYTYLTDFGDPELKVNPDYSRVVYTVYVTRNYLPYLLKVLIPIFIIMLLAYLVFFVPADRIDVSSALSVTSLLAAVAFQITISDNLSSIGYLTNIDKVFYIAYFLIAIAMLQSLFTYYLDLGSDKQKRFAVQLDVFFKIAYPLLFIVSLFLIRADIL